MTRTKGVRQAAWLLIAVSGSLLLGALAFQFIGGLAPCEMCYWQRYAHLAVLAVAGLALISGNRAIGWLAVLAMAIAAGLGLFHAGVELKWWQGVTACTAPVSAGMSTADMLDKLMNAPLVRCDQIPWSLLGISMAGWNALISAGAALCGAFVLIFTQRRPA
ncbi:disulfide bond formation protein B [Sandaracinobacter neustonicus]|uniref:Disulfide bond formation protein B n=1 Tax=Sandaracinobacter neustonicus TaxID=1715348 RepID=A0A501XUZ4_9SPHN|nr:disulfide bond formation protein B [Sandaracinobacter neustonicus]TPE64602.1 disulfide bond formation protein B [Sandaracinobacter neustonicus]